MKSTIPFCLSGGIAVCFFIFHHFSRQLRQQVAVACWATKTGCPFMGVCFPSFIGSATASLSRMKSSACRRIVPAPFSAKYLRSAAERWNLARNFDLANFSNASSLVT